MAKDPDGPPSSRLARLRKLAGLGAHLGSDALARGVKRLAGFDPSSIGKGTAEKLVATLGDLKGAAMKLGQVASMDPDLFPPEVRAVLARLQNEAPPMPFERVAAVLEDELGGSPDELFAEFSREGRTLESALAAALAVLGLLATAAAIVFGVIVMSAK